MKTLKLIATLLFLGIAMGMTAQTASELKIKASKEAKKQARIYRKQGWEVAPGALPMERQLDRCYLMEFDTDIETGESKFAFGEAISTGQFYDAAKVTASEMAKGDLVGKLHTEITREVTAVLKNKQLPEDQAQSISGVVEKSKSITVQRLSNIQALLELHRKLKNGNTEVMIRYGYNRDKAKNDTFEYIKNETGIDLTMQ